MNDGSHPGEGSKKISPAEDEVGSMKESGITLVEYPKNPVPLLRTGAAACENSLGNQREIVQFPFFLALPVCIDSNDKHS